MSDEDMVTKAAQHIMQGDFMGAMSLFEAHTAVSYTHLTLPTNREV